MSIRDNIKGRLDLYKVDPRIINEKENWNVRTPSDRLTEHINWLKESIREEGVREPLTCYLENDTFYCTNGHCRLEAVRILIAEGLDIPSVPVRVEDRGANEGDRILSMLTRNSGLPLTALETAEVIKRLLKHGWEMADVAKKTGYTTHHIKNLLNLSAAPKDITDMVANGQVSATLATSMIAERGAEAAADVLKDAIADAEKEGKKKVTKQAVEKSEKKSKVAWNTYGPALYKKATELYAGLIKDRDQHLSELGELLCVMDDKYGKIGEAS